MAGEIVAVWLAAVIVPTALVLFLIRKMHIVGTSRFEAINTELRACVVRENELRTRVAALEAELKDLRAK